MSLCFKLIGEAKISLEREMTKMMKYDEERELVENTISQYPATFHLKSYPKDQFRLDSFKSYVNDLGSLQLVLQRLVDGAWLDFTRTTVSELDESILVEKKAPKASKTAPKPVEIEIKEKKLQDGSPVFSVEIWTKNERVEIHAVDLKAACELRASLKANMIDIECQVFEEVM